MNRKYKSEARSVVPRVINTIIDSTSNFFSCRYGKSGNDGVIHYRLLVETQLCSKTTPITKQMIPLTPEIAPITMLTESVNIAPETINTIPEIRKFSLIFFT